jgi:glutathione peroxidase
MRASLRPLLAASLAAALLAGAAPEVPAVEAAGAATVYGFEMKRLDGSTESLGAYRGQVLLLVNTASRCGFTPQYEGLQALHERYRERGFSVLGFPSNDFGAQEPGSDAEIGAFCRANYGVSFPMFSKIPVTGAAAAPLYRHLTALPAPLGGPVRWNFQKYLVDRDGEVVARFDSRVAPDAPALVERLEALLAEPAERARP